MTNNNEQGVPAIAAKPAPSAVSRIRNYFLTGLIVAGPVAVTLWLIWWFVTWVDNLVRPFIPVTYRPETYLPVHIPGLGLIIAFVALTLLGFLTANLVGRKLVDVGESFLSRMPIVRPIYRTAKQIFQTLFSSSGHEFSPRRPGRISVAGHVVAGFPDAIAERGNFGAAAGNRARLRLHAVHAEPDHRLLLLRAAARRDRSRHYSRSGDAAADVGGHHPARRRRRAEAPRNAGRNRARRASRATGPRPRLQNKGACALLPIRSADRILAKTRLRWFIIKFPSKDQVQGFSGSASAFPAARAGRNISAFWVFDRI